MRRRRLRSCVLLLAIWPVCSTATDEGRVRVLFVGNSLTYENNVPNMVKVFAREAGVSLAVTMRAEPNWSLEDHARSGRSRDLLSRRWDVVVLQQGASMLPESAAALAESSTALAQMARAAGTPRVALYAPMPRLASIGHADVGSASYAAAADAANACVLPVTHAAALAFAQNPGLELHQPDRLHANVAGSLLAAAVIAQGLFGTEALAPTHMPKHGPLDPRVRTWLDTTAAHALRETTNACEPITPAAARTSP